MLLRAKPVGLRTPPRHRQTRTINESAGLPKSLNLLQSLLRQEEVVVSQE